MYLGLGLRFGGSGVAVNPLAPVNTVAPVISGTTGVGDTLTITSDGTWTNTPLIYTYQWRQNGVAIVGQTASTYVIVSGDQGYDITATVTAINASGLGVATSNAISIPGGAYSPSLDFSDARNSQYL